MTSAGKPCNQHNIQCGIRATQLETGEGLGEINKVRYTRGFVLVQVPVQTEGELVELMQQGIAKRTVARTGMNAASSRSHCLVMLMVEKHWRNGAVGHGKLCLVDLAGGHHLFWPSKI